MEVISKNSKIITAPCTEAVNVVDSVLSFSGYYDTIVNPNTPPTPNTRDLTFTLMPNMESELFGPACSMVTEWKVTKQVKD